MKVRKEIIRTGDHVYLDQHGKPAVLHTTPDKIDHYFRSGQEMLAANIPIPVPLEHQPSATPMNAMDRAADLLRHNAGQIEKFERDTIKNPKTGEEIHRLLSVVDVKDEQIGQKIKDGSIRWGSPWISSFVDGKGKEWNDVVTHFALTSRPRIHDQHPFESIPMALNAALSVGAVTPPKSGISVSAAGRLKKDGKPRFPIAFSLLTGVPLSADSPHDPSSGQFASTGKKGKRKKKEKKRKTSADYERELDEAMHKKNEEAKKHWSHPASAQNTEKMMDNYKKAALSILLSAVGDDDDYEDDDIDVDVDDDGIDVDTGDTPPVSKDPSDDMAGAMAEEPGDVSFEELIPHLLEMHGISVPAGGKGKEFLQSLVQGLLASAKQLQSQNQDGNVLDDPMATPTDPLAAKPKPPGPVQQESPTMYMSLEQINRITDPEKKQMATMLFSLQQETGALRKNKLDEAAKKRSDRIERLAKRLPARSRDKLLQMVAGDGAKLSLGSDGIVRDPMDTVLEIFEQGIPDLPDMLRGGVKLSEESHPADSGVLTDAQAEELANQQTRRRNPAAA